MQIKEGGNITELQRCSRILETEKYDAGPRVVTEGQHHQREHVTTGKTDNYQYSACVPRWQSADEGIALYRKDGTPMQIDPELERLIARILVSIVIEVGKLVMSQRTQAREGRKVGRRPCQAATQRIGQRRRRARLAACKKTAVSKERDKENGNE